jgi:hypothetical protein
LALQTESILGDIRLLKQTGVSANQLAETAAKLEIKKSSLVRQFIDLDALQKDLYKVLDQNKLFTNPALAEEMAALKSETKNLNILIGHLSRRLSTGFTLAGNLDERFLTSLASLSEHLTGVASALNGRLLTGSLAKITTTKLSSFVLKSAKFISKRLIPIAGTAYAFFDLGHLSAALYGIANESYLDSIPASRLLRDENLFNPEIKEKEICGPILQNPDLKDAFQKKTNVIFTALSAIYEEYRTPSANAQTQIAQANSVQEFSVQQANSQTDKTPLESQSLAR